MPHAQLFDSSLIGTMASTPIGSRNGLSLFLTCFFTTVFGSLFGILEPRHQVPRVTTVFLYLLARYITSVPSGVSAASVAMGVGQIVVVALALPLLLSLGIYRRTAAALSTKEGEAGTAPSPLLGKRRYETSRRRLAWQQVKIDGPSPRDLGKGAAEDYRRLLVKELQSRGLEDFQVAVSVMPGCILLVAEVSTLNGDQKQTLDLGTLLGDSEVMSLLPAAVRERVLGVEMVPADAMGHTHLLSVIPPVLPVSKEVPLVAESMSMHLMVPEQVAGSLQG